MFKDLIMKVQSLLAIILCFLFIDINAQNEGQYHVVQVRGAITNVGSGKSLNRGDVVKSIDKLQFGNAQAMALVINASGKFTVKLPFQDDDRTALLENSISPVRSRNQISTRGFANNTDELTDLKSYFGKDMFAIIGDDISVKLNKKVYPLNSKKFIVFYYTAFDDRIAKKIRFNDQQLVIEKEKLMNCKGRLLEGNQIKNVGVYQYEADTKLSDKITEVSFVFVDELELKEEFNTIIPFLQSQGKSKAEVELYLQDYFIDVYGFTDKRILTSFIDTLIKK